MPKFLTPCATALVLILSACDGQGTTTLPQSQITDAVTQSAQALLSTMSLEEKIGQIIQADISAVSPEDLKTYNLGSILNGGNSAPGGGKTAPPEAWIALADEFWAASTDTSDGGVGIPALWGTDAVHGHNNLQTATIFPHNIGLGAANNPDLMKEIGRVTAREIRATGLDWTFAPTLAVAQDDRWGRAYESYSERPEIVAAYAKAMVEGLQGQSGSNGFLKGQSVIATAKHFIGDGGTELGIDKGDTQGEESDLIRLHGAGYGPAIGADVQTVMASFSSINGEKMHGSKHFLTDVLRNDMGFEGFVVGDWNGHSEVPGCTATNCPEALMAGIDMYMAPDSWKGLYASLLSQAQSGEIPMSRLDEAVLRILKVKVRSGLMDAGKPSLRATSQPSQLGTDENRAIARQAVRESLVLLKNTNALLPLKGQQTVLVTGSGANSMQQQTGGWTLNWQGTGNPNSEFLRGETIFSGLETAIVDQGGKATLSENGTFSESPDVAIVVFGEQPYAEFFGDTSDLVYEFTDGENLKLIKQLKAQDIPVVSIFLTGRPLWVNPHLNASDAFVVGWLPGTEGGGIADVLVADAAGKARYDFTGRLSFSWPENGIGNPINSPDDEGVLFAYGHGLSYADKGELGALSEDAGVERSMAFDGSILNRGAAAKSLQIYLGDSSNANTPVEALVSQSLGGIVSTRGVDYQAQEDARQITWSGKGSMSVRSPRPIALSSDPNAALTFKWRIDDQPDGPFSMTLRCGRDCSSSLDISGLILDASSKTWMTTQIPLACFEKVGTDQGSLSLPLSLNGDAQTQISIASVTIETNTGSAVACPG